MFELIPVERQLRRMANFDPFHDFDDMERSFFGNASAAVNSFRTDVLDTGDAYRIDAELPGFKKEDISLDVENDVLTIACERKYDETENKKNFVRRERFYGSFSRSFDVSGIDVDKIDAAYSDGVLTVTMPKKAEIVPPTRKLEIR